MKKNHGFTLLELMVVMALLSLLMLGITSVMSTVSSTSMSIGRKIDSSEEIRANTAFLRSVLSRISAQKNTNLLRKEGEHERYFKGTNDFVEWLGNMPARYGMGGLTYFRIFMQDDQLILSMLPWDSSSPVPDWSKAQNSLITSRLKKFSVQYQNAKKSVHDWSLSWTLNKDLPTAIQLMIETEHETWPMTVIEVHQSMTERSSGAVFGGTR